MMPLVPGNQHEAMAGSLFQLKQLSSTAAASIVEAGTTHASSFTTPSAILQALVADPCSASAAAAAAVLSLQLAAPRMERFQQALELVMVASRLASLCNRSEVALPPSSSRSSPPPPPPPPPFPLLLPLALHRVAAICMIWQGQEQRYSHLEQVITQALAEQSPSFGMQPSWVQVCRKLPADVESQVRALQLHVCSSNELTGAAARAVSCEICGLRDAA